MPQARLVPAFQTRSVPVPEVNYLFDRDISSIELVANSLELIDAAWPVVWDMEIIQP